MSKIRFKRIKMESGREKRKKGCGGKIGGEEEKDGGDPVVRN